MTTTVTLPDIDIATLDALVASGHYDSREAVVREAVSRLVEDEEQARAALRAAIDRGLADVAAGRVVDMDVAFDRVEARLARKVAAAA